MPERSTDLAVIAESWKQQAHALAREAATYLDALEKIVNLPAIEHVDDCFYIAREAIRKGAGNNDDSGTGARS